MISRIGSRARTKGILSGMRTQVGIIGGGPAGLLLARILSLNGIDCVLLERKDAAYVLGRIRAGLLEQGTVDLLKDVGCGDRLQREGLVHDGTFINFDGEGLRIDFHELIGKRVTVYGQTEVTRDLMEANAASKVATLYDAEVTGIAGLDGPRATIAFTQDGKPKTLECDYVAGCDGYHGVARSAIPASILKTHERVYPFGWLGILAN
jgi:p-hydroxybenzoate 3-monooxygenase